MVDFAPCALRFLAAGIGAPDIAVEIARVQSDQQLTLADRIARPHMDLLNVARHLGGYRHRRRRANGPCSRKHHRALLQGDGRGLDRDRGGRRCLHRGRLLAPAGTQYHHNHHPQ